VTYESGGDGGGGGGGGGGFAGTQCARTYEKEKDTVGRP